MILNPNYQCFICYSEKGLIKHQILKQTNKNETEETKLTGNVINFGQWITTEFQ